MKVLHLPAYFPPEKAASMYLSHNLYSAITESGMDMVVYTPVPTRGISENERVEYHNRLNEILYDGKMNLHRFLLMKEGKNAIIRAFRYLMCNIKQFWKGAFAKEAKECDVMFIMSTPPTQGAMGALVKKFSNMPLVYNLQDIFPDSLINNGLAKQGGLLWKIGRKIENFTYKNADKIIVISEDFKKNIMAKGVPEKKIEVIYNWVDQNAVTDIPREKNILFDTYGLDRMKFYITYNGNIGLSQNMDLLISVAEDFMSEFPDIQFVLVGEGAYYDAVKRLIKEKKLINVHLLPFQPYEVISHVFSLGDASLVISKPGTGSASVPSKTWSIMSASRPVIANFDENELKSIIENNQCGIFSKAGDKEGLKKAILTLYNNPELCRIYGNNGRKFVLDNLTKEVGTQKYVDVIKSVVRK
ncbi:MAG: glycosyltransferase family 4 protein [Muribaculaceae bacterium]|nr:glycosyltransferase family 4 protein [Muribaculaceae bacterium]